jgi:hypothetical protein
MADFDAKAYWTKLAAEAGIDAAQSEAVLKALENPKIAEAINLSRHDTFSREMDSTRKLKADLTQWYYKDVLPTLEARDAEIARLRETQGNPPANPNPSPNGDDPIRTPTGDYITRDQLEKLLAARDANVVDLWEGGLDIVSDYQYRFKDKFPASEFRKFAEQRPGMKITEAYGLFIQPKVDEIGKKDFEEKLKAAREEGARDALTRHRLPVDSAPKEQHPFFDRIIPDKDKPAPSERDQLAEFVSGWNEATEKSSAR